ncbi:ATP-grasp domain-containing protein [Aliivibrio fischeri]|uniref:ATP-grasp domain-containing protein n=1 Tax=Aliivibrio fischeri TaxID=668 RepID=A0A510UM70_ALIFS|nr:ATP-grasp domain-containing protein [Aliivibrio fischeri]GEK15724.1 hypothetical protein AFI02nite_37600 [Aliivibrio fischeri]
MQKHLVMISPHKAMLDIVDRHNIKCTIIDKINNIRLYKSITNHNLILCDYECIETCYSLLNGLHNVHPISTIVTLTEKAIPIASEISERLHLSYTSLDTVDVIYNKVKMRSILESYKDFSLPYIELMNKNQLRAFIRKFSYPVIVKPKDGVGSVGVQKICNDTDFSEFKFTDGLIAEQFIEGAEYSVECFSFSGDHKVIAITEKTIVGEKNFTELGHIIPANISKKTNQDINNYIVRFLDIIGIKNGASHTEIKIFKNNIHIIETHNRIGGDRISSLVKLSTGIDLVELSILWPLDLCKKIEISNLFYQYSSIRFLNPKKGFVESINGVESLLYSPNIISVECLINKGDNVKPISDSFSRYGFIISVGKSFNEVKLTSIDAINSILINYKN